MKIKKLDTPNKILTFKSVTTIYIDYSGKKRILEVAFVSAKVYQYLEVEPLLWKQYKELVLSGGSSGEFVNKKIKPDFLFQEVI